MRIDLPAMCLIMLTACRTSAIDQLRSDDSERVKGAREALVARGVEALPELKEALRDSDLRLRRRVKDVIGRITGQWGDGNGVAWRRSFEEAKKEAQASRRPILLLNLFGRFDEEFC